MIQYFLKTEKIKEVFNLSETKNKWLVWAATAVGSFISTLGSSIVNIALPIIATEFSSSLLEIQWIITAYLLCISSLLPFWGWLGDRVPRYYLFLAGYVIIFVSACLCGLAPNLNFLIIARILQAFGASMLMANGFAIITGVFEQNERAQALGSLGSMVALGVISGTSIGGFLVAEWGWSSIFFVNIPFAIIGLGLTWWYMPRTKAISSKKIDIRGTVLFALTISAFTFSISQYGKEGWPNYILAGIMLVSILSFYFFNKHERKIEHPLIDLQMFANKAFSNGNKAGFCSFVVSTPIGILLPFYLYGILQVETSNIGFIMAVFPVAMLVAAPISGYFSDRVKNPLYIGIGGLILSLVGVVVMLFAIDIASIKLILVANFLLGAGNGMFQSPNNASTLSNLPKKSHGVAGSIIALVRNLGMIIGTALAIQTSSIGAEMYISMVSTADKDQAFVVGFLATLFLSLIFAILALIFTYNKQSNMAKA